MIAGAPLSEGKLSIIWVGGPRVWGGYQSGVGGSLLGKGICQGTEDTGFGTCQGLKEGATTEGLQSMLGGDMNFCAVAVVTYTARRKADNIASSRV